LIFAVSTMRFKFAPPRAVNSAVARAGQAQIIGN
jgi:hypothetical protein